MADEALAFATKYDRLQAMYRMWFRGAYDVTVRKPVIRFEYPRHGAGDRDIASHLLWQKEEQRRLAMMTSAGTPSRLLSRLTDDVRVEDGATISYAILPELSTWAHSMTAPAMTHSLPLESTNGRYSLAQSRLVWHALAKLALIHQVNFLAALQKLSGPTPFLASFLRRDRLELVTELAGLVDVGEREVADVIDDLTLPPTGKVDLRAQPLIAGSPSEVWLVPGVFMSLLWEPCTCLLWARLHSDEYSRQIASQKVRLAQDLSGRFDATRWKVSAMRKLKDPQGKEIGDADVAIFDPGERYLLLVEVKWLIPPEDIHEVLDTDEALIEGVHQVVRAQEWVRADPERSIQLLFPGAPQSDPPLRIDAVVLCRGAIGSECIGEPDVPIYDYDQCVSAIESLGSDPLSSLMNRFASTLELNGHSLRTKVTYQSVAICGTDFRVPSIEFSAEPYPSKKPGRNEQCDCGSGLKFKKCCGR
jgi:hypothetical protein